ncbi:MAG: YhjD/YihY/BrkB family envelope integrity protein, partial [Fusobacteriaceae bacterium]
SILLNQSNFLLVNLQSVIQSYSKIYGSFSIVLIFLIWLKIIWFIILIGAHFTYILQNKDFLKNIDGIKNLNFNSKYQITTFILREFIINFLNNEPPLTMKELSEKTSFSMSITQDIIYLLKNNNMVYEVSAEESDYENNYKLSYNCDTMTLNDIKSLLENNGTVYNFDSIDIDFKDLNKRIIDTF